MKGQKIVVIGAGFSSLSAACYLAKAGYQVQVLEKNSSFGGRARRKKVEGYTFDIGPSFYWMPDVFEKFFNDFGKTTADYYELLRLSPGYQIYFGKEDSIQIADNYEDIKSTFEGIEKGSGEKLDRFMKNAKENYDIAIKDLVYKPGENLFEIINFMTISKLGQFVSTIKGQVSSLVKDSKLKLTLEFPCLFLGAKPGNTPSFYNFMNYADFQLGTWHPKGGMYEVVEAMVSLARELGVDLNSNAPVRKINIENGTVHSVETDNQTYSCDILLSGADYHHTESILPKTYRQYSENYWNKKTFAPSALMYYVGIDKKLKNVSHHTLFFDADFDHHAEAIYDTKEWTDKPLFYASFPSITDDSCAPSGKESAVFLIPIAPGLEDTDEIRDRYFNHLIERVEQLTGQDIANHILFKESFCVNDFVSEYNSYKGNAYGLANTLFQTHIFRPRLKSNKISNLYFTGQLTVPGPGVPPSLISGNVVSDLIVKYHAA